MTLKVAYDFQVNMSEQDLQILLEQQGVNQARQRAARWVESANIQRIIMIAILINGIVLGMETSANLMAQYGKILITIDKLCLGLFIIELSIKIYAYRLNFWRNGWNVFDFMVIAIALVPGAGAWAVLRSLRVLRVLRLLTVVPSMRKVVAAFLHSIPGLSGVMAVMMIFFYTASVLATKLFGASFPEWFGTIGRSLYSLFQIMTLESWSMGIVRPILEVYAWAWLFFVPFIIIATFTILNLFIGIIVSTMQELSTAPDPRIPDKDIAKILEQMEKTVGDLRMHVERRIREKQ